MATRGGVRISIALISFSLCGGCGFLPGFGFLEDPALYAYSVDDVANQVSCELQSFMAVQIAAEQKKLPKDRYKWVLDEGDVSVKLSLQTDTQGYVNFTGVNISKPWSTITGFICGFTVESADAGSEGFG